MKLLFLSTAFLLSGASLVQAGTNTALWYPSGGDSWGAGHCELSLSDHNNRHGPGFATEIACCNTGYSGQVSGDCLTNANVTSAASTPKWYPSGGTSWPDGFCELSANDHNGAHGHGYDEETECCEGFYGGQMSGDCLTNANVTAAAGTPKWYPSGGTSWPDGFCELSANDHNGAYGHGYDEETECCEGFYGGQMSGDCLTSANVTAAAGTPKWYPSGGNDWPNGFCELSADDHNGRHGQGFTTNLECCKSFYGGQMSVKCLAEMGSSPTTSPTAEGGLDVWYPDYDTAWTEASCKNDYPLPSGRPTYASLLDCCKGAYAGQVSGKCLAELEEPPTTSPTAAGGLDFFYPDYDTAWSEATCKNDRPVPFGPGGRPIYDTMLECCKGAYAGQTSGKCLAQLDNAPTQSPTGTGGLDVWYPDYETAWSEAECKNERPLPSGRPTYPSKLICCKGAYGGQVSGKCLASLDSPPTTSPTGAGGLDFYYPDYDAAWNVATCKNDRPLPFLPGGRPVYDTMLDCCKGAYGGQTSGACLLELDSPPTASPTGAGGLDEYYPDYSMAWPEGKCINDRPMPSGRPVYTTQEACCNGAYGGQISDKCMCDVDPCHSCKCGAEEGSCAALKCGSSSEDSG